jgi:uncharacterized protein (TIGR03067 family)
MRATVFFALLVAPLAAAAPGAKDPPPKQSAIVGEWEVVSQTVGGITGPWKLDVSVFIFSPEGKFGHRSDGTLRPWKRYRTDDKADPPTLDIVPIDDAKGAVAEWLFKVDGDTLTLSMGPGKGRPASLESPKGAENIILTLKRVMAKK